MRSASSILLVAATAALVGAQTFPDQTTLPGCGQTCFTNMLSESTSLGCTDEAASCLCVVADFMNGLIGCANGACAADLVPSVTSYLYSVCYTATISASTATTATTYVPTTSAAVTYSTNGTYTGVAGIIPTTSGSSATATATTLKSSTKASSSTASSTSASASASSTAAASSLSAGAKAGIGIGSAVGAVAVIAAIVAIYLVKRHNRKPPGTIQISDPMPGSGRVYANELDNASELEMKSRRYEDMVPRQVPRTMV